MADITIAVPDEVLRRARIRAAERGTSVSAMVRDFLVSLAGGDAEDRRLERLQASVTSELSAFSASDRLGRDQAHDRARR